jgi:predicted nuclease of predicted toxin-antitoxin system
VKLFIDECLSPKLATRLNATGDYDAVHPLHVGRRGEPDHRVLQRCIAEDRVIVTENARDFRRLVGRVQVHPGLIILPAIDREGTWTMLRSALAFLEARGNPADAMVNHVLEVDESGSNSVRPPAVVRVAGILAVDKI